MAGKVVDVTLRLVDQLSSPLNAIGGKLAQSANQWIKAGKQIQNAGKSISAVGSSLTKSLTVPIATAGTACVKLASDFEAGMSSVKSICGTVADDELPALAQKAKEMGLSFEEGTDATSTAMNILSEQAKKMGAQTKFSAREATEAYQYMAMAGWGAGEMMDGISGIMYLAGATGEDLATTSDIVTDALTAFGMTAKDTESFVDILAKTSSSANTNVSLLGESFKYVAPVAGALGYSAKDTAVALGVMANSGIKASTAGTSLRSWLSRMSAPTKQVQTAMDKLGLSLTDEAGNMKDFSTIMRETRTAFAGLSEAEKASTASALAGKTGMSGLLAIVNASEGDFNDLTDAINGSTGACKEMYDTANDNLQGQLTILKSTVESIAISFGERMTPYVKKLTTFIQNLANKFNSLTNAQKDTIIKVGLIVASIGPALLIFGKLVTGVGKAVAMFGKIGKAFKTFGSLAGIISSPAGIVIAVIAGIALGATLIIKNWDKIKPWLMKVKQWFVDTFGGAGGAFSKFKQAFKTIVDTLSPIIQKLVKWFQEMIPKAVGFLLKIFEKIKPVVQKAVIIYINLVAEYVTFLANAFAKIVPVIAKFIKNALQKIAPVMRQIINAIKKAIPVIEKTLAKAFEILVPIIKSAIGVVKKVVTVVGSNLIACIKAVIPVLKSLGEFFGAVFSFAGEKIKSFWNFISPIVSGIIKTILSIAEKLQPAFSKAFSIVGNIVITFSNTIKTIFTGIMGVINGLITFITGVFTGNWRKAWEGVKTIFSSIFSTFADLAKQPINAVIGIINKAISSLNQVKISIPDWVPSMGGKSFGINIPTIPTLAVGTDNWKGGIVQISEKGGEIVDLPSGSRVYPHDESVQKAYQDGSKAKGGASNVNISIPKLADQIVVRDDSDIDKIAQALADKLEKVSQNLGGGEPGYLY